MFSKSPKWLKNSNSWKRWLKGNDAATVSFGMLATSLLFSALMGFYPIMTLLIGSSAMVFCGIGFAMIRYKGSKNNHERRVSIVIASIGLTLSITTLTIAHSQLKFATEQLSQSPLSGILRI